MENIMTCFVYILYRIAVFFNKYRSLTVFLFVLSGLIGIDILFHDHLFDHYVILVKKLFGISLEGSKVMDIGWLPEVWLSILVLVVGTLIIVVSVAAQNVPEIISIYMRDWLSLFYLWFLVISGIHAVVIKFYSEIENIRPSSVVFNVHFLFVISSVLAIPYIFYILQQIKPTHVIKIIFSENLALIRSLPKSYLHILFRFPLVVEDYQYRLFEALNQLDDLLKYVDFKEPKAGAILSMSQSLREYIRIKSAISTNFFKVTPTVRSEVIFKFHNSWQFEVMEQRGRFYEEKCLLTLIGAYTSLLENKDYQVATIAGNEVTRVGLTAIQIGNDDGIEFITVSLNTLIRQALKHGVAYNEPRNLYTVFYSYGNFLESLCNHKKIEHVKLCFFYFRLYGQNIFTTGGLSLNFITHVIADEMRKILIQVYKDDWDMAVQEHLLNELLQVDMPPTFNKEELDRGQLISNGVRWVQVGLALFYHREGMDHFVMRIIQDILDDLEVLGETSFRLAIEETCNFLKISGPTFWEHTERGNINIYYTPDKDQIDSFKVLLYEQMEGRILTQLSELY